MKKQNVRNVFVAIAAMLLVTALLFAAFPIVPAVAAPAPAPLAATTNWRQAVLYQGNGITATANGTGYLLARPETIYTTADCYNVIDVTDSQTVTIKLQHSGDSSNWVDLVTYANVSADTTAFTTTTLYGAYLRSSVSTLGTANPVTITTRCVLKD